MIRPPRGQRSLALAAFALLVTSAPAQQHAAAPGPPRPAGTDTSRRDLDWPVYRGDPKANQYSPLAQIHAANIHRLRPAWAYYTGDASETSSMQVNPIIVDGRLYISTPTLRAVALNAATGEEVWVFDPPRHREDGKVFRGRSRGVTYWEGAEGKRIFHFVRDRVYALDAATGEPIQSFGTGGFIDLRENLGVDAATASIEVTSPGVVYRDYLIVGSRVPEVRKSTPGHVRAFDAVTGELEWIFHTIPREGEFGYDTWEWVEGETYGGANPWGGFSVDAERGLVFFATGSPTPDFYGGYRKGMNLFGNSVLALDAATGERKWHFQTVHHDLWDYDNPSAPVLVTIGSGEDARDAVVQLTKMGLTFVLDRETGEPIFPVAELPVPASDVPGEQAWPTQPFPLKPAPLSRLRVTEADLTNVTPESRDSALAQLRRYASGPMYTPPSLRGTLTVPGHLGGVEWHGASYDQSMGVLYVNANDGPTINKLNLTEPSKREVEGVYGFDGYTRFLDPYGVPAISPPWGTLNALDLTSGDLLWSVPLGEYPELAARGIRNTGTMNYGGAVATAGGLVFIAATADERFRAFEKHSGRLLWEHQLPAGGYATPSVYMVDGRQYVVIAAGGGGKNGTKSGDAVVAFALPEAEILPGTAALPSDSGWIELFDGSTLNGWAHLNGWHTYTVEDGAIVGRTEEGSPNSFLATLREFADFELELEVWVDSVTNQGIQFRSKSRTIGGRVNGPQVEVRRYQGKGVPTTGVLYGEALGTGWLSSQELIDRGHRFYRDDEWNHVRLLAEGPRMRTWVNGHAVEDLVNEEVYGTHPSGFIALQIHGMKEVGPLMMKWRNIRVRPIRSFLPPSEPPE